MPRRRTAGEILDGAGGDHGRFEINTERIFPPLQPGTKKSYKTMMELWDEYQHRNPGASIYELDTAKRFMKQIAETSRGNLKESPLIVNPAGETIRAPTLAYIHLRWEQFIGMWPRREGNVKLARELTESVYHYISTVLLREIPLSLAKRPTYWFTVERFIVLQQHTWRKEWTLGCHTRTLVNDHAGDLLACYTAGRIGEYHESSARRGSGRGLLYKDLSFLIIRNAKDEAELIICPTRDAKGMTLHPNERPEANLYEDMQPLYANPVLPFLCQALADDCFVDYKTWAEIKRIPPPPKGFPVHLAIDPAKLHHPVLQMVDRDGPNGKIRTSSGYAKRLVARGRHAGFDGNIKVHDVRREALVKADENGYSVDARMQFAGQRDPKIFNKSYNHKNRVSGVDSYWGKQRREDHLQEIRASNLKYNPQLLHSLPAKQRYELEHDSDFVNITLELTDLQIKKRRADLTDREIRDLTARQGKLYEKKRQLVQMALTAWQGDQRWTPAGNKNCSTDAQSMFFERTRRLDPVRDRLAENLFLDVPLRSDVGDTVVEDMIQLCKGAPEVAYRPSCMPTHEGRCPVKECAKEMDRLLPCQRWPHVYKCYRDYLRRQHGFAQLCYLCDEWVTGKDWWIKHCTGHLAQTESLPIRCEPVNFRQTVAWPGYCITCIFRQERPEECMRCWEYPNKWKEHVDRCLRGYWAESRSTRKPVLCCDPRCQGVYNTEHDLRCHMIDWHGYPFSKSTVKVTLETVREDKEPFTFVNEGPEPFSKSSVPVDIQPAHRGMALVPSDVTVSDHDGCAGPEAGALFHPDRDTGPAECSAGLEGLIDPRLRDEPTTALPKVPQTPDMKSTVERDEGGPRRLPKEDPTILIVLDNQALAREHEKLHSPTSHGAGRRADGHRLCIPQCDRESQPPMGRKRKRAPPYDTSPTRRRSSKRRRALQREHGLPFSSRQNVDDQPPAQLVDGEEEYLIDSILDERAVRKGRGISKQYLVKWTGYSEPTWTVARLLDDTEALERWDARVVDQ